MSELYMLTEHSEFMMGFVFFTDKNRAVVIDGGREEDIPYMMELVGDREIAAWILTHPHYDHIEGFCRLAEEGTVLSKIDKIYYNFPSEDFVLSCEPDIQPCIILRFNKILPKIQDKTVIVKGGEEIDIDELHFDFLLSGGERYRMPRPNLAVNESSIAFKVTAKGMKSVLFLGDMGPESGKDLLSWCGDKLPSDIVQMAHHGHSGVDFDVYEKIAPEACMWCAREWLYNEPDVELEPGLWGTIHTRKWMDKLGVKTHYVTKDGTLKIDLY